jgi:7 transmembrane sweet-taste receptor of 3 GCPR
LLGFHCRVYEYHARVSSSLFARKGSPLSRAMHGVGLIQMQGTISQERFVIGREQELPMFDENSTQGSDRFRVSWRDALQDADFVKFVQSKLPVSLEEATGFDRSENFTGNPHGFLNFNYDAVTALGLAMCRAGENKTFFTGDDIYHEFLRSDFEGASGNIRIIPETGTRHHTTIWFVVWNVRIIGVNADGYSIIEYAPSYRLDDGSWKEIPGNAFVYADGGTSAPNALPPVSFNYNYIGGPSRAVAYSLMAVTMVASMASIIWTVYYRHSHVVDSAQPLFLISVSIGAFIMVSSVVALGFEETLVERHESLNSACMAIPWLYFIGTSVALSGLLAKTEAVHQVIHRVTPAV